MRKYTQTCKITCDCCGKEETKIDPEAFLADETGYTTITIFAKCDSHRIDLCPECAKFVLDYLKENCNDGANWPEEL